jgi:aminomethyltransferase
METTTDLKRTALTHIHEALGAKMVPFAGYLMPVQYSGVNEEHATVREAVGIFDVSHMGEFLITGPKALELIQRVSSNDASKLVDRQAQYGYLPNETGGVVDDFLTYRLNDEKYLLVVNASNIEKDWNWISLQNQQIGAQMENISDRFSLLAVQGPKATEALQKLTSVNLSDIPYYRFVVGPMAGIDHIIISATGYTGAGGFELYVHNENAEKLWNAVMEAGASCGIKPIGLGARDTLRLEKGFCLYGNEITDETSPLQAGLGWVTKFTKDFVNSAALKAEKEAGVQNKLVGFKMIDRGIPRHHYPITNGSSTAIGSVTSGTQSPTLKEAIGLGYVPTAYSEPGTEIYIQVRDKELKAVVTKIPFL